jgi:hypothetical protein
VLKDAAALRLDCLLAAGLGLLRLPLRGTTGLLRLLLLLLAVTLPAVGLELVVPSRRAWRVLVVITNTVSV